jgi:hypothetical protein
MSDAERAIDWVQPDGFFQIAQLAGCPAHGKLMVIAVNRQAGRVVAAIFQALQAFQYDRNRLAVSNVSHDAAHMIYYTGDAARAPADVVLSSRERVANSY